MDGKETMVVADKFSSMIRFGQYAESENVCERDANGVCLPSLAWSLLSAICSCLSLAAAIDTDRIMDEDGSVVDGRGGGGQA